MQMDVLSQTTRRLDDFQQTLDQHIGTTPSIDIVGCDKEKLQIAINDVTTEMHFCSDVEEEVGAWVYQNFSRMSKPLISS